MKTTLLNIAALLALATSAFAMPNGGYRAVVKTGGYTLKGPVGYCQFYPPQQNELGSEADLVCLNLQSATGCVANISSDLIDSDDIAVGAGGVDSVTVGVTFSVDSGKCPFQTGDTAEMTLTGNLLWTPAAGVASSPTIDATFSDGVTGTAVFSNP